jgi:predicted dehydrogenase
MSSLGSAIVGTGFIAPVHVEALRRLGRPVLGVLGSTPDKSRAAAAAWGLPRGYDRLEDVLNDPAVSVVHLASPNRLHYSQCKQVLASGKHVLCEKPLAMTAAESAELVALARESGRVAAVCYNVRFYPLCLEARARIAAGDIGRIHHVSGAYVQDWLLHESDFNWRVLSEEGGALRAVADIGTHWLDLVTTIAGLEIEQVCADLRTCLPIRRKPKGSVETFQGKFTTEQATEPVTIHTEDYGSILLRFRGETSGCLTVSQVTAGRKNCLRFEIAGTSGAMAWDSERPNELWLGRRDRPNEVLLRDPSLLQPEVRRYSNYPGGHNEGFPDTFKQLFRAVYGYFEAGNWKAPHPFPTFEDGHREIVACEAILRSQREGGWVHV